MVIKENTDMLPLQPLQRIESLLKINMNKQECMNKLLGHLDSYEWCPYSSAFSKAFYQTKGYPNRKDIELTVQIIHGAPQDLGQPIDKFKRITSHQEYWLLISLQSESNPEVKVDFDYEFRGKRAILLESHEDFNKALSILKELEECLSKTFIKWLQKA